MPTNYLVPYVLSMHPVIQERPLKPIMRFMERPIEKQKIFKAHIYPDLGHMLTSTNVILKYTVPMLIFLPKHYRGWGRRRITKRIGSKRE